MEGAADTLAVPTDEHTPLYEIVDNFKGQWSLVRLAELFNTLFVAKTHDFTSNNL
jgi:hypothetical protein